MTVTHAGTMTVTHAAKRLGITGSGNCQRDTGHDTGDKTVSSLHDESPSGGCGSVRRTASAAAENPS
jgi:hypothetical protein